MTAIFRTFGNTAEGVSYAIIFCNLLVPLIEKMDNSELLELLKARRANNMKNIIKDTLIFLLSLW